MTGKSSPLMHGLFMLDCPISCVFVFAVVKTQDWWTFFRSSEPKLCICLMVSSIVFHRGWWNLCCWRSLNRIGFCALRSLRHKTTEISCIMYLSAVFYAASWKLAHIEKVYLPYVSHSSLLNLLNMKIFFSSWVTHFQIYWK